MCLCAQVACQKTLHTDNKPRAWHLWKVSGSSSWCRTQVSEKLSRAGSIVTCTLRLFQSPHNCNCIQTRQEDKVEFNINILDAVSPLSTFSTRSQQAFSLLLNINLLFHVAKSKGHFPALILLALSSLPDLSLSSFQKQALFAWLPRHPPIFCFTSFLTPS